MKQISIWGGVIIGFILIIWGMVFLANRYSTPKANGTISIENKIQSDDWVRGNRDAKVILTEYSDFQCPACGAYFPVLKELEGQYSSKIALVYRHFPLDIHQFSKSMAIAAEAAGKQGKFWEMHDLIFSNQGTWEGLSDVRETVTGYARSLGLNVDQFQKDLDSNELKTRVDNASEDAINLGLYYTPTFFLNGKLIENPKSLDEFKKIIDGALTASSSPAASPATSTTAH